MFQIWCLYLSYKESYEQNTGDVSFLDVYNDLHYTLSYQVCNCMLVYLTSSFRTYVIDVFLRFSSLNQITEQSEK